MSEIHKVGPYQITLALPASVSVRWDIVRAYNSNPDRAFAAALAACWNGPGRPKVSYAAAKFDPLAFGGMVIDELAARGAAPADIVTVGARAWMLLADAMVPAQEINEAADFTAPTEPTS